MQVDLCAEEMGNNVRPAVSLLGDISAIVAQVTVTHIYFFIHLFSHSFFPSVTVY